ncbi:hypothetical protein [Streptomyces carpaticus]|uniref:hypothetical protein n=1 Tax=Streptomyces carpaticus TaxID=285558 RepID=UPI0031F79A4C
MEPTGAQTVFVAGGDFPARVRVFIGRQLDRWPGLLLDEERFDRGMLGRWELPESPEDPYPECVTFCRDDAMNAFWEENGYDLDASGEGPFALFFRWRAAPPGAGVGGHWAVTLLTPDEPAVDPFSRSVVADWFRP